MKWTPRNPDLSPAPALAQALGISLTAARILVARGYATAEDAHRFLDPSIAYLHAPVLLRDMNRAADRLHGAILSGEKILLYGDYDVDGTSAVVVLTKGIELLGGNASFHVPHRLRDGYGMRSEVVEEAAQQGVALIVSVDTGIRANEVVAHAATLGIDVIVTDHHLPETELPPALAVVNPNRPDCTYPEKNLCGAAVALKLIDATIARFNWPAEKHQRLIDSFLKLVAIATVADVVPLTGENRIIVKRGLDGLDRVRNPGLRALLEVSGFEPGNAPTAGQVAFRVAPRINAAGRMASAADVIELFTTSDEVRARELAGQLHELNKDRQQTEAEIAQNIVKLCVEQPVTDADAALVFSGDDWHRGVVGIVASRVVERFHRPTFVISVENGVATGSGRSISQFHLLDALESMPELFTKFGGHRQAAGVTLPADKLPEFRERLRAYAAGILTPADFEPELLIDTDLDVSEIDDAIAAEICRLAPFGFGNPAPTFVARNVALAAPPDVKSEQHLFFRFKTQGGRPLRAKAWRFVERLAEFPLDEPFDIAFQIEDDPWSAARGWAPWQMVVKDVKPASAAAGSGMLTAQVR